MKTTEPTPLDKAYAALEKYKETGVLELPNKTTNLHVFSVWAVIFQEHLKAWKKIRIAEIEATVQIAKSYIDTRTTRSLKEEYLTVVNLSNRIGLYEYLDREYPNQSEMEKIFDEIHKEGVKLWVEAFDDPLWSSILIDNFKRQGNVKSVEVAEALISE